MADIILRRDAETGRLVSKEYAEAHPETTVTEHRSRADVTNEDAAQLVFEALGAASTCWSGGSHGIFQSERALEIGNELLQNLGFEVPNTHFYISNARDAAANNQQITD